uniref:Phosphatidic acid phosphatase type 2/haloperoxidase domain-containing protein n=1 Tax=Davidia involucrata TaxID=16924 RepID=A0A5B7CA29_DAVIN
MSAATAILYKPTTIITFFPKLDKSLKLKTLSCPQFPTSKLVLCGESVSKKPFSWSNRTLGPNTMTESTTAAAFRGGNGDEGVRTFEQEAFIHESSDFRPNFMAGGLQSTLNSLSKWLVAALFGAVLLWRHDAEALWAAMGSVLNTGLSTTLKQILNQERPLSTLRSDPGMPSSHAQSIFFTVMFAVLSMVEWFGVNGLTITLSGLMLALGSYFSWLRVSQQLHTISQVVVGALLGSIFSIFWLWSWDAIVLQAFISHLWVRIFVVVGASGFCLGFLLYVIRYWVMGEP